MIDNQIKLAKDLADKGEVKKARAIYSKLYNDNKDNYKICLGLADTSLALGMKTYARDYYEQAIQINNTDSNALVHYAQVLYDLKDFETASGAIEKAIEISPKDDKLYYNKAIMLYELKEYDKTIPYINKAIMLNNSEADYFQLQGLIYEALDNKKEAIFAYEKYMELSNDEKIKETLQKKVKSLYDSLVQQ